MNVKTKAASLLILVFIIGMFIGSLVTGAVQRRRFREINSMRGPAGIERLIERTVKPDDDQRVKLRPIIDKYSQKIFDIREINRSQMDLFIDSLRIEVTPILTAEQIEALERARQEMQRHRDSDRSRR